MVPEFMHRDFYRSQEDLDAVQTKTRLKPNKPAPAPSSGGFQGAPLRSSGSRPSAPIQDSPISEETVAVPLEALRTAKAEPAEPPRVEASEKAVPRPVQTRNLNIPLVLCLLFVVGLFLWREQTRPPVAAEPQIPLSQEVKVAEEAPESGSVLGEDNPYPAMAPAENLEAPGRNPAQESPESSVSATNEEEALPIPDFPGEGSEQPAELPSDSGEASPDAVTYPQRERAVQRAAILERVSDRTVNRNERDRRMERELRDDSLFPDTAPESIPDPVPPAQSEQPAEATTEPASAESLFPEEPTEAASQPAELPADPLPVAAPPSNTQAVSAPPDVPPSYQIDEPEL